MPLKKLLHKTVEELLEEVAVRVPKPLKGTLAAFGLGSWVKGFEATMTHFRAVGKYRSRIKMLQETMKNLEGYALWKVGQQREIETLEKVIKFGTAWEYMGAPTKVGGILWGYIGKPALAFTAWNALFSSYGFARNTVNYQSRYAASQYFRRSYYM